MESHKLALKLFVKDSLSLTGQQIVPVFQSWIQQKKVADHLVIDVADYQHVHNGPGTLLITYEANFATDGENGELGLLYVRKQPIPNTTTFAQRLAAIARPLLLAAQRLEEEMALAGKIQFRTDELLFRVYDRLLAPSNVQTFDEVRPDLEAFIDRLYGSPPQSIDFHPSAERLFEVRIQTPRSTPLAQLLSRLGNE